MNTTENNKIIAEFLTSNKQQPYELPKFGKVTINGDWKTTFFDTQLRFHKDFNWLMEAVEKTKTVGYFVHFNLQFTGCKISVIDIDGNTIFSTHPKMNFEEMKLIDCVYKAVVSFIEWYNEQKNK